MPAGVAQCGDCVLHPPPLDACLTACAYHWPWPECIAQFKFRGDAGWAAPFSTLLRSAPWVEPAIEQADLVLPIPLAPARLRERGFTRRTSRHAGWRRARSTRPCCCAPGRRPRKAA